MNEMEKMSKEVADLEHALMDKTNSAKLAETRLENRLYRLGAELVQDEAHFGLRDEVLQLRQTQQDLRKKIDDGKLVLVVCWFLLLGYFTNNPVVRQCQEHDNQI